MASLWNSASSSLKLLIASSFLMSIGFYSLVPFLAVHFTREYGWSFTLAGLLLATRQLCQQGLTFLGGICADRVGWHRTLVTGVWLRSFGFLAFAFTSEPVGAFTAAAVSGLGGAFFEPAYKLAYDRVAPAEQRTKLIAFREVVANVALGISGVLGMALMGVGFRTLSLAAGLIYVAVAVMLVKGLGRAPQGSRTRDPWLRDMREVISHRVFLAYTLLLVGYYYLVTQLYLGVPRAILAATGSTKWVSALYSVIALTVIFFQLRATRWLGGYARRMDLIGLGTLTVGAALALMSHSTHPAQVLLGGVLFAAGTILAAPVIVEVVPGFCEPRLLGSFYGFNGYAIAIGGAASASLGGWLAEVGEVHHLPSLPWLVCSGLALLSGVGFFMLQGRVGRFPNRSQLSISKD